MFTYINSPLLVGRVHLSTFIEADSGLPFNITVPTDLNGDSVFNDRPAFATDLTRPSVVATSFGTFDTNPISGQTIIPVNYGQSPAELQVGAEIYRSFTFGPVPPAPEPEPAATKPAAPATPAKGKPYVDRKYSLFLVVEAQNAINHVNLGQPVGVLGSPNFGKSISLNPDTGNPNANRVINFDLYFRF
jgi:hypothetical protein